MKKFLNICFLLGFAFPLLAQGSLQFNQVKLLEGNQANCTVCWTVPANKVWKMGSFSTNSSTGNLLYYYVNTRQLGFFATGVSTNDARYANPFPFWLPAGATFGYTGLSNNQNVTFFALEFNVIP